MATEKGGLMFYSAGGTITQIWHQGRQFYSIHYEHLPTSSPGNPAIHMSIIIFIFLWSTKIYTGGVTALLKMVEVPNLPPVMQPKIRAVGRCEGERRAPTILSLHAQRVKGSIQCCNKLRWIGELKCAFKRVNVPNMAQAETPHWTLELLVAVKGKGRERPPAFLQYMHKGSAWVPYTMQQQAKKYDWGAPNIQEE